MVQPLPHPDVFKQARAKKSHEVICLLDQPTWDWSQAHFKKLFEAFKAIQPGQCLAIELPIRHGKSECITIRGAAHVMMQPGRRVLIAANTQDLAETFSRSIKEVLRRLGVKPGAKDGAKEWSTPWGSTLYAVGVGGAIEGRGFTDIFIDDPIASREDAESQTVRNKIWQWLTDSLWGRKEPGARVVFILSRWHEDDPLGRIRKGAFHASLWTFLTITALAVEGDILGRAEGEALWPERWSREYLEAEQKANPRNFGARYQANPTSQEGDLFKPDAIEFVQRSRVKAEWRSVVRFDFGATQGAGDSTSLCELWEDPNGAWYADFDDCRLATHQRDEWIERQARQRGAIVVIPQDPGSAGKSQVTYMVSRLAGLKIEKERETGSKETRATPVSSQVNAGNVFFIESAAARRAKEQLRVFPNGAHDDFVDVLSGAFNWLIANRKPERKGALARTGSWN